MKQISRLTFFTRFDPVVPKEQVFSMEPSIKTSEEIQINEMEDAGREQEGMNGKACHQRRGGSLSCFHFSTWPLVIFAAELALPLPDSSSSVSSVQTQSRFMSALYWLCGMERQKKGDDTPMMPPAPEEAICSLREKKHLKLIVNINLIICLCVAAFIFGFWAWQASYDTPNGHMVYGLGENLCTDFNVFFFFFFFHVIPKRDTGDMSITLMPFPSKHRVACNVFFQYL